MSIKNMQQKLRGLRKSLRQIVAYPPKTEPRRTDDGYPAELVYDEFSYNRMVDSYREGISKAIKESK